MYTFRDLLMDLSIYSFIASGLVLKFIQAVETIYSKNHL